MKWLLTIFTLISALFSTVPPEDIPEQGISFVVQVSVNDEGNVQTDYEILVPENAEEWAIEEEDVNEDTETARETENTEVADVDAAEVTENTEATDPTEPTEPTAPTEFTEAIEFADEEETVEVTEVTEVIEITETTEKTEATDLTEPTDPTEAIVFADEEETAEVTEVTEVIEITETTENTDMTASAETTEEEDEETTETTEESGLNEWNGEVLQCRKGYNYGPSGKETWYDLNMAGVIKIMRDLGYSEEEYPYWVREDGCKMFGPYIMVAGDIRNTRTRGDIVETSLGTAMVCDHCNWAEWHNPNQLDIATDWVQTYSQRS